MSICGESIHCLVNVQGVKLFALFPVILMVFLLFFFFFFFFIIEFFFSLYTIKTTPLLVFNTTTQMNFPPPVDQPSLFSDQQVPMRDEQTLAAELEKTKIENFPYHNPFDVNSYPITNPPLFDSTMMVPYTTADGVPRRRRISISNGQIGQIINHEAFFEDEKNAEFSVELDSRPQSSFDDAIQSLFSPTQPAGQMLQQAQLPTMTPLDPLAQQQSVAPAAPPPPTQQQQQQQQSTVAGVPPPNHQLLYNNEVIYNPNDGPIPGTAAWKRERLLERNRIAASKCRQRKKQAQLQLQDSMVKMEQELQQKDAKIKQLESTIELYKVTIRRSIKEGNLEKLEDLVW